MDKYDRPLLSLSLDLDNLWSYMKTHGDPGWESYQTYLDALLDSVLPILEKLEATITFFIVGQDALLEKNARAFERLGTSRHEVGNHSLRHEPWLHQYSKKEIEAEVIDTERAIEAATGKQPEGFRGPGFSVTAVLLEVLAERGYLFDASTFPTFLGPLARAYYFWQARSLSRMEREKRSNLFGTWKEGFRPLRPHIYSAGNREILEIPVTTVPVIRTPFHMSYLIYLAGRSRIVALFYLKVAIRLCKATRMEPSFLLHPLDFLGKDAVKDLDFFPGMQLKTRSKLSLVEEILRCLARHFRLVPMGVHAREVLGRGGLSSRPLLP